MYLFYEHAFFIVSLREIVYLAQHLALFFTIWAAHSLSLKYAAIATITSWKITSKANTWIIRQKIILSKTYITAIRKIPIPVGMAQSPRSTLYKVGQSKDGSARYILIKKFFIVFSPTTPLPCQCRSRKRPILRKAQWLIQTENMASICLLQNAETRVCF